MSAAAVEAARDEVVAGLEAGLDALEWKLDMMSGVIAGNNRVIRVDASGLYLVRKGDGYGVGGLAGVGLVLYSPESAKKMVEHCKKSPGFEAAEAVFYVDALKAEIEGSKKLLESIKGAAPLIPVGEVVEMFEEIEF